MSFFSGGVKLEKEITNDETPEAAIFTPSENIKTEMFKEESVHQLENKVDSSNEVKSEENVYQPEIQFTTSYEVKLELDNKHTNILVSFHQ